MAGKDMTVPCEDGLINLRVGAIIMKNGKLLMVGNDRAPYLYSVGGRIKFGEAAIHIYEKCGYKEIDRPKEVVHSTMNRFFLKFLKPIDTVG